MKNNLTPSEMADIREQKNLRFAAATMAMQGILSDPTIIYPPAQIVDMAVEYADLLITRLNKPEDAKATN